MDSGQMKRSSPSCPVSGRIDYASAVRNPDDVSWRNSRLRIFRFRINRMASLLAMARSLR